jgi:hypothetical protein
MAARQSPKLFVGVRVPPWMPVNKEAWQSPVYCNSLENCRTLKGPVSSNLTASAKIRAYSSVVRAVDS